MIEKACALVFRKTQGRFQILCFEHPTAGVQLIKGGLKRNETPRDAAIRELMEESGLTATEATYLGKIEVRGTELWHCVQCHVPQALPDRWSHDTTDDDGHRFEMFWIPVGTVHDDMHQNFQDVLHMADEEGWLPQAGMTSSSN